MSFEVGGHPIHPMSEQAEYQVITGQSDACSVCVLQKPGVVLT